MFKSITAGRTHLTDLLSDLSCDLEDGDWPMLVKYQETSESLLVVFTDPENEATYVEVSDDCGAVTLTVIRDHLNAGEVELRHCTVGQVCAMVPSFLDAVTAGTSQPRFEQTRAF